MLAIILAAAVASAPLPVRPDPAVTPGAVNPAVTQANIATTICAHGWTATIRPPASYTDKLKRRQLAAMGVTIDPRSVEEDHLISLELGGNPNSPLNLWPEPWAGPFGAHAKDRTENAAKRAVCKGTVTLADAQHAMATDWITFGRRLGVPLPPEPKP